MANKYFLMSIYILMMSFGFPFMRYMSLHFNVLNNNALRFLAGGLFLLFFSLFYFKSNFKNQLLNFKNCILLFIVSILLSCKMYFFIEGLKYTSSIMASIFSILALPLSILLAAIFYLDERKYFNNVKFLSTTTISILASIFFIFFGKNQKNSNDFLVGIIFLTIFIIIQAIQNLVIKKITSKIHSLVVSSISATTTGIFFLILALSDNKISELKNASPLLLASLIFLGIYGTISGSFLSFLIINKQGIVIFNILQLIIPISTAFLGYFILNEKMNLYQIISSLIILTSSFIAIKTKN